MGSVEPYSTAQGRRYRARYRDPERKQRDKWGFATKRDAELFLASIEVSKARGEFLRPEDGRITLGELASDWLKNQSHLKASSARPLEIAWRIHVAPRWGTISVNDVRHSDVQAWITSMSSSGASTVIRSFGVLAAILDVAVRDRRVLANQARGVKLPRKGQKERAYLTHQQVELLASNAGEKRTLVLFLAYTGLRWGEVAGLRVADVDLPRHRANIRQNAVMVGGSIVVGTPKSHEARAVSYPAFLTEAIAELCTQRDRAQPVFGSGDEYIRPPDSRKGWWITAVKKSQLVDPTFPAHLTRHDLRHTAASLAISAGANVKVIQRMLGHASAAMTLDVYGDLFDADLDTVSSALDKARANAIVGGMWGNRPN